MAERKPITRLNEHFAAQQGHMLFVTIHILCAVRAALRTKRFTVFPLLCVTCMGLRQRTSAITETIQFKFRDIVDQSGKNETIAPTISYNKGLFDKPVTKYSEVCHEVP